MFLMIKCGNYIKGNILINMQQGFAGVIPYYEPNELNLKSTDDTTQDNETSDQK